jgi:hypothetical protein
MNYNHILSCFFIGMGLFLFSCNNKGHNKNSENFIKTIINEKSTGDIIYSYKQAKDSNYNYAIVYDSMNILKYKSYYEGNHINKYVSYNKNGNITDISYAINNKGKTTVYQWAFIKNGKLDLFKSEFAWTFFDKTNNDYFIDIVYYTPLYPEKKRIKIGYISDDFIEGKGVKLDTFYFSKQYIITEEFMPKYLPCFFYKRIKLKNLENGLNTIRGKVESFVYAGDDPATGDSTFLFYTKYFVKKFEVKK